MLGYPFINELFKAILTQSKQIQGRFYICPHWGAELNGQNLDQIVDKSVPTDVKGKYPLCIMMPPRSSGDFTRADHIKKRQYDFQLLFLTTTYMNSDGTPKSPAPDGLSSTHTIFQDWHDMQRCAEDFITMIGTLIGDYGLGSSFILSQRKPQIMSTVTTIGNEGVSGVMLSFGAYIFPGCEVEDYPAGAAATIDIPTTDSHPAHLPG